MTTASFSGLDRHAAQQAPEKLKRVKSSNSINSFLNSTNRQKSSKINNQKSVSDLSESQERATDELMSDLTKSNASRMNKFDSVIDAVFINYFNATITYTKVHSLLDLVSILTLKWRDDSIEIELEKEVTFKSDALTLCDFNFRNWVL